MRRILAGLGAVIVVAAASSAQACLPTNDTAEERAAFALSQQRGLWAQADRVYVAELTSLAVSRDLAGEPDLAREGAVLLSPSASEQVEVGLAPILALKGEMPAGATDLAFERAVSGPGPCNPRLWRSHEQSPSIGQRYVVFEGGGLDQLYTVLAPDLRLPEAMEVWDEAATTRNNSDE